MRTMICILRVVLRATVFLILLVEKVSSHGLLKTMKAECINDGIKVHLEFQEPFYGVAYSFGHYENERCRYIEQDSSHTGLSNYSFLIPAKECGTVQHGVTPTPFRSNSTTTNSSNSRPARSTMGVEGSSSSSTSSTANEIYIENTLLIQNDPSIQEAGDLAQKLRCVWQKEIHKPLVASLPFQTVIRRKHQPARIPTQHKIESMGTGSSAGVRFESKGQVESVPYYSYKRKWARSLRTAEDYISVQSGAPGPIPLAFTSTPNRSAPKLRSILGI